MSKNEHVLLEQNQLALEELAGLGRDTPPMFCTVKTETAAEKATLFNVINNPSKRVADMVGKRIKIKDFIVQVVHLHNERTNELLPCKRIVIIDTKGVAYAAVSEGIFNALTMLCRLFGVPTWPDGLEVEVKEIQKGVNRLYTLEVIINDK